ncbi:hypothetical protein [Herbidospora cretacea]|nr:hypothetical protein [Herbidospora cretacea]
MSAKLRRSAVALLATLTVLTVLTAPPAQAEPPKGAVSNMPWG